MKRYLQQMEVIGDGMRGGNKPNWQWFEVIHNIQAAGVGENYDVDIFDGGHGFAANKAFDFFDKHLKKK